MAGTILQHVVVQHPSTPGGRRPEPNGCQVVPLMDQADSAKMVRLVQGIPAPWHMPHGTSVVGQSVGMVRDWCLKMY